MGDSLRILIVDDEQLARQKIVRYLNCIEDQPIVLSEAENGLAAIEAVAKFAPTIVFLDIQMPGLSGFEFLYHLEDRNFQVVFQTAHDEFALKAFEENACDYLLKPFSRTRFQQAYARAKSAVRDRTRLMAMERQMLDKKSYLSRVSVTHRGERLLLDVEEIDYFVSRDHYTCLYVSDVEYVASVSLRRLTEVLDPAKFLRVHRRAIVNASAIVRVGGGSIPALALKSGLEIEISRRCRAGVNKWVAGSRSHFK